VIPTSYTFVVSLARGPCLYYLLILHICNLVAHVESELALRQRKEGYLDREKGNGGKHLEQPSIVCWSMEGILSWAAGLCGRKEAGGKLREKSGRGVD
jgi:hypothetical protein